MEKTPANMRHRSTKQLLEWFLKRKEAFNISFVSKNSGIPHSTLDKWTKGERPLPDEWIEPLTNWIKQFKK